MTLQGTKNLETWCKRVTDGKVNIVNMSTSWRNGLGFCAVIHHFRPDLIDFEALDPEDVYGNNELAFRVAETHLGIPALLDPVDMVECSVPDRLSILTYLAQMYHAFHSAQPKHKKLTGSQTSSEASSPSRSVTSPSSSTLLRSRAKESCHICQKPVFILERINVAGNLLHRTCFKCKRCNAQLSVVNFYETESGEYCCDMCPDEETNHVQVTSANKKIMEDWSDKNDNHEVIKADKTPSEDSSRHSVDETKVSNQSDREQAIDSNDNVRAESDSGSLNNNPSDVETCREHFEKIVNIDNAAQVDNLSEISQENIPQYIELSSQGKSSSAEQVEDGVVHEPNLEEKLKLDDSSPGNQDKVEVEKDSSLGVELESIPVQAEENTVREEAKVVSDESEEVQQQEEQYPDDLNPFGDEEVEDLAITNDVTATNPFGSEEDLHDEDHEDDKEVPLSPRGTPLVGPPKPPRVSLNPFGSDFEDDDDDENLNLHPPTSPTPSSISGSSGRKKRQAPAPPQTGRPIPSPRVSLQQKRGPRRSAPPRPPPPTTPVKPKDKKERENLNRRSQQLMLVENSAEEKSLPSSTIVLAELPPNKAHDGVWKKKKGPAPPRPVPPKLQVKKLPRKAVNQELHDIEVKQQELERQGVKLEKTIRELCEKSDAERAEKGLDNNDRDSLGPEVEDLIMQLFELVNEKNELYRRQTELMYMKREQRLEEEYADIEYQIRVLMSKAETLRTDDEKLKEEKLISRLMEIVAQRNEIVDCLEMDRLRELEEDESIEVHMGEFAAVRPTEEEEKKKKKKKEKKKKKKNYDDDKDIDTSEHSGATPKSSPKKASHGSTEKDLAKKMKKKLLSTLKPVVHSKKT